MARKGRKRGTYLRNDTIRCSWCGEPREVTNRDAQTCGGKCRTRLARYRQLTGFDPLEPPGEVTVKTAFESLVVELMARERQRRFTESLNNQLRALERDQE